MNDDSFDTFLKQLKPAPLPAALRLRLAEPPARLACVTRPSHIRRVLLMSLLPIAAAVIIGVLIHRPAVPSQGAEEIDHTITVRHHEKTLLHSKRLRLFEIDGEYWELSQQRWREESFVATNDTPVLIRSSEIKDTLACTRVNFD